MFTPEMISTDDLKKRLIPTMKEAASKLLYGPLKVSLI